MVVAYYCIGSSTHLNYPQHSHGSGGCRSKCALEHAERLLVSSILSRSMPNRRDRQLLLVRKRKKTCLHIPVQIKACTVRSAKVLGGEKWGKRHDFLLAANAAS